MEIQFEQSTTSFEELFGSLRGRIVAYAKKVANPELAEDIVQETFLRLLRYKKGNLGPMTFSFILTTTRNVARSMHAKCARDAESVAETAEPFRMELATREPLAHLDIVYGVLERMPERQREALYLTEVCGLSEFQAALAMAMSRAAINARKRDALCKLRQCLDHVLGQSDSPAHTARPSLCA